MAAITTTVTPPPAPPTSTEETTWQTTARKVAFFLKDVTKFFSDIPLVFGGLIAALGLYLVIPDLIFDGALTDSFDLLSTAMPFLAAGCALRSVHYISRTVIHFTNP
ncbi:MAG: hypothetical protein SP1CHLAM54_05160 [Chlamydiia bacterium]|nr:hypothetical protein [Chlamydiia bacterium]MCH9615428.1 hypothetical protein [Chlamydiia bacterium]MCH9628250.1 hypothetical protein [Chlamydiia bacterium]